MELFFNNKLSKKCMFEGLFLIKSLKMLLR